MQGRNEFHLCPAEMTVAAQEYLNKRMGAYVPKVDRVEFRSPVHGDGGTFILVLVPKPTVTKTTGTPPPAPPA